MNSLGHTNDLHSTFEDDAQRVTQVLGTENFGVISRFDLDDVFRKKLNISFKRYVILGACNPSLAHRAVSARPEVGVLLPSNVTIEETASGARVRIINASKMMAIAGIDGNSVINELDADASARLERVAEN